MVYKFDLLGDIGDSESRLVPHLEGKHSIFPQNHKPASSISKSPFSISFLVIDPISSYVTKSPTSSCLKQQGPPDSLDISICLFGNAEKLVIIILKWLSIPFAKDRQLDLIIQHTH